LNVLLSKVLQWGVLPSSVLRCEAKQELLRPAEVVSPQFVLLKEVQIKAMSDNAAGQSRNEAARRTETSERAAVFQQSLPEAAGRQDKNLKKSFPTALTSSKMPK
jgi:hypothetical protein